jgi:hypothetical protein
MKARIEKKLSKRLVQIYPSSYGCAWIDDEQSELAYEQKSQVRHCPSVGGEYDSYSGDCNECYTAWASWLDQWPWHGPFTEYPYGHRFAMYPNTEGFKPTTRNLLKLAAACELASKASA